MLNHSLMRILLLEVLVPFIYPPQLKSRDAPASNWVPNPTAPGVWIVNEIRLSAPSVVGKLGVDPDGHKKYVLNPTVETPELVILKV